MKRKWAAIADLDGHYVSNRGEIAKRKGGAVELVTLFTANGCLSFKVYVFGHRTSRTVANCVATAFVPNPNGYKFTRHINGDKKDNRAENLQWMSNPRCS